MFVLRMGGIAGGFQVVGIAWRAADIFRRTTADGIEQERKTVGRHIVEPFFKLDHMVPAVAEVIEIMDCLGAGLVNDIGEARLAGINELLAVIVIGIGDPPMYLASEELEEMAIRPAKRRLSDEADQDAGRRARQGVASRPVLRP